MRSLAALFLCCVLLLAMTATVHCASPFRITVFDIGQGDSQLIQFPSNYSILVDAGEVDDWNASNKAAYVARRIEELTGGRHVNACVITHLHLDHIGYVGYGGVWALMETHNITFDLIVDRDAGHWVDTDGNGDCDMYNEIEWTNVGTTGGTARSWVCYMTDPKNKHAYGARQVGQLCSTSQIAPPDANTTVQLVAADGYGVTLVDGSPLWGDHHDEDFPPSENDFSLALLVEFNGLRYVTSGDVDGEYNYSSYYTYNDVETVLAERVGEVDIYHVDHHGSKHSSGEVFIATLKPSVSLCSCGNNNTYGHPGQIVVDRTLKYGDLYLTEDCIERTYYTTQRNMGDIIVESADGSAYLVYGSNRGVQSAKKYRRKSSVARGHCA